MSGSDGKGVPNFSVAGYPLDTLLEICLNSVECTCFHSLMLFRSWFLAWANL